MFEEGQLSEIGKLHGWRLLNLIDAYRAQKEPLDMEDIELLGHIAKSTADLHVACTAFLDGCTLEQAVLIFT